MPSDNPAKQSLEKEQREQRKAARRRHAGDELHDALAATFPASDPISAQAPVTIGASSSDGIEDHKQSTSRLQELLYAEVRSRPMRALAWAAAIGFVAGLIASR